MNDDGTRLFESTMRGYLKSQVSRAQLLKAAGAGLALAALPGAAAAAGSRGQSFPFFPSVQGRYTTETVTTIINLADTAEHLAITFLTAAIGNAGTLGLNGLVLEIVQAALLEEIYHSQFLEAAGATPLTDNFSVPDPKMLSDYVTFFSTVETAESIFVAAYMDAVREFAELGQPTLAKYAYQIGAVEAEHRTLARAAIALKSNGAQDAPPNNKAFETDLFLYVADAARVLTDLGFLGTGAIKASFPGYDAALAAAGAETNSVLQKTPNNAVTSVAATGDLVDERS